MYHWMKFGVILLSNYWWESYRNHTTICIGQRTAFCLMRRNRFEHIRKMIYFVDPLEEDHDKSLCKLDRFLDILRSQFKSVYIPEQHIAIDEYFSLWKDRLKFKVQVSESGMELKSICCVKVVQVIFQISLSILVLIQTIQFQISPCPNPLKHIQNH